MDLFFERLTTGESNGGRGSGRPENTHYAVISSLMERSPEAAAPELLTALLSSGLFEFTPPPRWGLNE
jgi:hypothetical protein